MNRCITCHKLVSRIKAQSTIIYDDHQYYVCCPLCHTEFEKEPQKYIDIARVALGDYTVMAHTQTLARESDDAQRSSSIVENLLKDSESIFEKFSEFEKNFSLLINQLNGDTTEIPPDLIQQVSELKSKLLIHTGACHFNAAVIRSESKVFKLDKKNLSKNKKNENEVCH